MATKIETEEQRQDRLVEVAEDLSDLLSKYNREDSAVASRLAPHLLDAMFAAGM